MTIIQKNRGFTLIELLLVVSIIGLLSSVVLVSVGEARAKARDAQRKSDLRQIQIALEMNFDATGSYRVSGTGNAGTGLFWLAYDYGGFPTISQGLVNAGYLTKNVIDPSGARSGGNSTPNGTRSGYVLQLGGVNNNQYTLWANLERPSARDLDTLNGCALDTFDNYNIAYVESARLNYCVGS